MNYFHKNLKHLRTKHQLSQEQFARMFGINKSNVNSYEMGTFPKIELFMSMMDYFELDAHKFVQLDMEQHSVSRAAPMTVEEVDAEDHSKKLDTYLKGTVQEKQQFRYLEDMSNQEIKRHYIQLYQTKENLLKDLLELKEKYIAILEKEIAKKK